MLGEIWFKQDIECPKPQFCGDCEEGVVYVTCCPRPAQDCDCRGIPVPEPCDCIEKCCEHDNNHCSICLEAGECSKGVYDLDGDMLCQECMEAQVDKAADYLAGDR